LESLFFNLSPEEQTKTFAEVAPYRFKQLEHWLYEKRCVNVDEMSNISKDLREKLRPLLPSPTVHERIDAPDGSTKLLLGSGKFLMETVILRYKERTSLCISTQVGCKLACRFCQTGKLGFFKNLTVHDIMMQFYLSQAIVAEEGRKISHVVFMGMGEPLDNYTTSIAVANLLTERIGISAKNVTISTSGIAPKIIQMAHDTRASLALSLHSADPEKRTELMPINQRHSLDELKQALLYYQKQTGKMITLEYILIDNVNTSALDAKKLVKYVHGLRVKVNLIPFNAHPGMPYQRPSPETIRSFQAHLSQRSIPSPVRYSLGLDISAACGQLAAKNQHMLHDVPSRLAMKSAQNQQSSF
jgi:23S rRNA (adenine2503-C2)-methyltransferase